MTIVTHLCLESGREPEWDAAFRERIAAARTQPGWVAVQLCIPADALNERVVIGTWQTRADWEDWHGSEAFQETRRRLEQVDDDRRREWWHEVLLEERRASPAPGD